MERNEYGYSGFSSAKRPSADTDIGKCPGTGDMWQGEREMTPDELAAAHKACSRHQLGMVYSPYQCWRMLYSADDALNHGTLFEELYKPLEERENERSK